MKKFSIIKKSLVLFMAMVLFLMPISVIASTIDGLEIEKNNKLAEQEAAEEKAKRAGTEAQQLQYQINAISGQINKANSAISSLDDEISQIGSVIIGLEEQITSKITQLDDEKKKMNQIVAAWYMEGTDTSLLQTIVTADTLSDAISVQEHYDSITKQIEDTAIELNKLKDELEEQKDEQNQKKNDVLRKKSEQEAYRNTSLNQKKVQDRLLGNAKEQKQAYLDQVNELEQQVTAISDEIYRKRLEALVSSGEQNVDGSSGYPYSIIHQVDPWLFLTRECTSYAAWNWNIARGKPWYNTRPGQGSAYNWANLARDQGYSVTSTPRVGALISWGASYLTSKWGHVAVVEKVNGDGTIDISEYNWATRNGFGYRLNVNPASYGSYSFIY